MTRAASAAADCAPGSASDAWGSAAEGSASDVPGSATAAPGSAESASAGAAPGSAAVEFNALPGENPERTGRGVDESADRALPFAGASGAAQTAAVSANAPAVIQIFRGMKARNVHDEEARVSRFRLRRSAQFTLSDSSDQPPMRDAH
jgi:hypothetical protein